MRTLPFLAIGLVLASIMPAGAQSEETLGRNNAGMGLFRQGKLAEAASEFQKAVQSDPRYAPARFNLAHAYESLGRVDDAIQEYRGVIALEPKHYFARNNLGVLLDKKGLYDEAVAEFEGALRIEPGNRMALNNLETARKNKAIVNERRAHLEKAEIAAQAKPNDPQSSYHVARLHASFGNKTLALQWLERALKQGYKEIASIRTDPVFSPLRGDREFELVLLGK
jgi:Tfp pilus assembly protein PilF